MVTETTETMSKMFEQMTASVRGAFDAGRRMQESWFDAATGVAHPPAGFDEFAGRTERVAKEWVPFVGKNVETFGQSCDVGFRAGQDVLNAAHEMASRPVDGDHAKSARRFWDASFDAVRLNVDNFTKTSTRTLENCSAFAQSVFADASMAKAPTKTATK